MKKWHIKLTLNYWSFPMSIGFVYPDYFSINILCIWVYWERFNEMGE